MSQQCRCKNRSTRRRSLCVARAGGGCGGGGGGGVRALCGAPGSVPGRPRRPPASRHATSSCVRAPMRHATTRASGYALRQHSDPPRCPVTPVCYEFYAGFSATKCQWQFKKSLLYLASRRELSGYDGSRPSELPWKPPIGRHFLYLSRYYVKKC